ncbi:MAG: TonB-dependent receptor [Acidobacteria bacterium]|nr:MAG: TonB-dependent receptor [Acidobacteriota bacterium]
MNGEVMGVSAMKSILKTGRFAPLVFSIMGIVTLFVACAPATYADVEGTIRGTVVDPSGAAVAGAAVKIVNVATNLERDVTSTGDGSFIAPNLPAGNYAVTVSKAGFRTYKQTGIRLESAATFVVSATLEVGEMSATVEVTAAKLQADTTTIQLGGELAAAELKDFPLLNRAWINLQTTLPGVVASNDRFTNNFSTNGSRTQSNNYTVNGTDSNDLPLNTPIANAINPDAIQEVKVVDSTLNPEYGRNSGGTLMVTTKSGTNQFHGSAFEFYRDTFMNAKNFFSTTVPPFHQNQFGGTLGGPIVRNKLFGFFSYQGTRQFQGVAQNSQVFTPAQRGGDFTGAGALTGTSPFPLTGEDGVVHPQGTPYATLFPTNHIPTVDFSAPSANLLNKYIPSPNPVGGTAYQYSELITTNPNQYLGRVDYNLSSKDNLFFYLFLQRAATLDTLPFLPGTTTPLPGFGQFSKTKIYQYTVSETHIFNEHMLNELKVGYNRFNFDAVEPSNVVAPSSLGFTGIVPQITKSQSAPRIDVTGLFTLGFSDNGPQPRIDDTGQLLDNVSYTTGKHAYKWGVDIRRGHVANPFGFENNGAFGFSGSGPFSTGNPGSDFLLGIPDTYGQSSGSFIDASAWEYYSFIQDQWRLRPNLTFTYGIGWQIDTPLTDHFNHGVAINAFRLNQQSTVFPTAPTGLVFPGDQGITSAGYRTHYNNFAPRIGFAWNPTRRLTVRTGWGIYYNNAEEEQTLQNLLAPPFALADLGAGDFPVFGSPGFATPFCTVNGAGCVTQKYPYTPPAAGTPVDFANFFEPMSLNIVDPAFNVQYAMNTQLSLQYQVSPSILATVGYVGAQGRRLEGRHEQNPYNATVCLATPGCQAGRAGEFGFPGVGTLADASIFASLGAQSTFLSSNYNSLQATVEKSLSHGLSVRAAYTYSHGLDNGSSLEGGGTNGLIVPSNFKLTYGNSAFDARHRLAAEYLYQIPDWGFHHLPSSVTKGWTFAGVTSLQAGFPIGLTDSSFRSLQCTPFASFFGCWDRPDFVKTATIFSNPRNVGNLPNAAGVNHAGNYYFDPASYKHNAFGTVGTAGRNVFHGPGINNTDLSFYKDTNITEKMKLQLRVDLFNAFNHAQFSNPSGNVNSSLFGRVTTTRIPARITQLSASFNF